MNPSTNTPRFSFVLPPSRLKRWLAAISAVLLTTLGAGAVVPAAQAAPKGASATVFSVPGWDYANVRSGPSTDKSVVKTIPAGSTVSLGCSTRGGNATGPYGTSDLWYKVAGTDTYIADVMILTGSDEAVTEACGETKPEPKPSAPAQNYNREAAVQWAKAHVYDAERFPYVNGNGGDCTWFLSQALWAGGLPKSSAWTPDNAPFSLKPPRTATGADYLKNHLVTDTGMATITELSWTDNNAGGAELGDIIAYDWYDRERDQHPDGRIDHLAIVTGFTAEGYPLVTEHTNAHLDRYWTYSESSNPPNWIDETEGLRGSRVYLIHVTY